MDEKKALVENSPHSPSAVGSCDQQSRLVPPVQPVAQPQPVVLQLTTPRNGPRIKTDYKSELSKRFGIAQLILGSIAVIVNTVGIILNSTGSYRYEDENNPGASYYRPWNFWYLSAAGIWCPLCFFSVSGAFSLGAARLKTRCMIVANLVLCIMSSIFAVVMLVFAFLAFGRNIHTINQGFQYTDNSAWHYERVGITSPYNTIPNYCSAAAQRCKADLVLSTVWVLVSMAEFIVCVWTATLCCRVLCCRHNDNTAEQGGRAQYYVNPSGSPESQLMVLDSQGRPIVGAQVVQIPGSSGAQQIQTNLPDLAGQAGFQNNQGTDITPPPPYEA